jgi:hypothetical protein
MGECKATWFRACKFRARFDYQGPKTPPRLEVRHQPMSDVLNALGTTTYVRDVCERCGRAIEREKPNA